MITVVIPVGPAAIYRPFLQECLDSMKAQTHKPSEVLLVDDMAHLDRWDLDTSGLNVRVHVNPWLAGCPCSLNFGVALAKNELAITMGSDDKLLPWAIEDCENAWKRTRDPLGYYWLDVVYDDGEEQAVPCGAAMVSKSLWRATGGYNPKSAIGANDSMLLDTMSVNKIGNLRRVESAKPPYWNRRHAGQITAKQGPYWAVIPTVRNLVATLWEKPTWT